MDGVQKIVVEKVSTPDTYDLRGKVLRPGFPAAACHFPEDARSVHFGARAGAGGPLVCVVSAHPEDSSLFAAPGGWRIRGMATAEDWQSRGVGAQVLEALVAWGRSAGVGFFWCNARERAIPFYERWGFTVESDLFDIPTVGPHKVMRKLP